MDEQNRKDAEHYVRIGWKNLEFEEKAHARKLVRAGYLIFIITGGIALP